MVRYKDWGKKGKKEIFERPSESLESYSSRPLEHITKKKSESLNTNKHIKK